MTENPQLMQNMMNAPYTQNMMQSMAQVIWNHFSKNISFLLNTKPAEYDLEPVILIIFVVLTYFHLTNGFGGELFRALTPKNKVVDEKESEDGPKWQFFISLLVFRSQRAEFFFSKKICQMKGGQNNKYDTYYTNFRSCAGLLSTRC